MLINEKLMKKYVHLMHILYEINQIVHKVLIKKNVQRIHITLNEDLEIN